MRNLSKLNKNEAIKDRISGDIKNVFEEKDYYIPVRTNYFNNNNYIEYEINGDRNKIASFKEHRNKIKPYLKYHKNFKKSYIWKIQLMIAINFMSFNDADE